MAIVLGSSGEDINKRTMSVDEKGDRTYQRAFVLVSDNINDGVLTVQDAAVVAGIMPIIGSIYSVGNDIDIGASCRTINVTHTAQRAGGGAVFAATASYSSANQDQQAPSANPLLEPIKWSISFEQRSVPYIHDFDDDSVLVRNSAGDEFDPPAETERDILVLTAEKNVSALSLAFAQTMQNSINSGAFLGFPMKTVKVRVRGNGPNTQNDITYAKVFYDFLVSDKEWVGRFLDQGYNEITKDGGTILKSPILDRYGNPVDRPQNLDGAGKPTGTDQAFILEFEEFAKRSFGTFGISISNLLAMTT